MELPSLAEIETAAAQVYEYLNPTPALEWPLINERCGCRVFVKHENHNPTGAFKVRGGLVYLQGLREREPGVQGLVTATRGNHGQSIAFAAARCGLHAVVVVPRGNSADKNRAMRALGAELIEHGEDFDEAAEFAAQLAQDRKLHRIPSFHKDLVTGVATYGLEFFRAQPDIDRVYVPIGLGSGICGVISAREALGLNTEVVGVCAEGADAYWRSFQAGEPVSTDSANTIADGMAVRVPNAAALAVMRKHVQRIVTISDAQISAAVRYYFADTHNVAEGAGAAPLAALLRDVESSETNIEDASPAETKVGLVLTGGNIDSELYARLITAIP